MAAGPTPYTLGVFPYVPPLTIDRIFGPVAVEFAKGLDRPVHLRTKSTFESFAQEMQNENYDIIFVHPFFYLDATEKNHYLPLARLDGNLTAVLMVPRGSSVRSLQDLAGRTVGLPPQLAAVSELVQASLIDAGLRPGTDVTLRHYRTKMSCLQAVAIGAVATCGVPRFILSQVAATNRFNFEVMFETPAVDPFAFAIHARVPETERRQLQQLIRDWCATDAGRAVLANGAWEGFVGIGHTDYERARRYRSQAQKFAQH